MQVFTKNRKQDTADELWVLQHQPVFTLGGAGKLSHIHNAYAIPVIKTDRGGQVTYHGPGQLVIYLLIDIKRLKLGVRHLVTLCEHTMIEYLQEHNLQAYSDKQAPGVYINHKKIGSVGLRVKNGASYHGLAFNVNMDLSPFLNINPCGYKNLKMTQLTDLIPDISFANVADAFIEKIASSLGYNTFEIKYDLNSLSAHLH